MALTTADFLRALRLTAGDVDATAEAERLAATSETMVNQYAPDAPEAILDEARLRVAGYLYDAPPDGGRTVRSPLLHSGAAALLAPYRKHRAGVADAPAPAPAPGGGGVDQTARASAARAQAAAEAAQAAADAAQADATGNNRFLQTFADRVRTIVEAVVPAWARMPDPPAGGGGGGVDQTARDSAAANAIEIKRNSDAVVLARQEAAAADAKAVAAQEAIPAKASQADVDGEVDDDDFVTVAKVFRAIARKVRNASTTVRGMVLLARNADVDSSETDTSRVLTVASAKRLIARIGTGRTDKALESFIERIVSAWAIVGNADGIPGPKTFDGLFKSESQEPLPAANARIAFDVGSAADDDVVDETDAEDTSFNISAQQAAEADAFIRVRYTSGGVQVAHRPTDVELLLQVRDTGAVIGRHNLPLTGVSTQGTAQFPVGDAGAKRWAVRVVTAGSYKGEIIIEEATYHSAQSLADPAIEHVVHPLISREAEERQSEDKRLTDEIARVEGIKAIVNGLPAPDSTAVKKRIVFRRDLPYQQTDADAFQVPATGFVQFIVGNFGATGIVPVAYCKAREEIMYGVGDVEVGLQFSATGKAALFARKGAALWESHEDAYNTTNGFVMLHWATARESGHAETELAELETRVEKLEEGGAPGAFTEHASVANPLVGTIGEPAGTSAGVGLPRAGQVQAVVEGLPFDAGFVSILVSAPIDIKWLESVVTPIMEFHQMVATNGEATAASPFHQVDLLFSRAAAQGALSVRLRASAWTGVGRATALKVTKFKVLTNGG